MVAVHKNTHVGSHPPHQGSPTQAHFTIVKDLVAHLWLWRPKQAQKS